MPITTALRQNWIVTEKNKNQFLRGELLNVGRETHESGHKWYEFHSRVDNLSTDPLYTMYSNVIRFWRPIKASQVVLSWSDSNEHNLVTVLGTMRAAEGAVGAGVAEQKVCSYWYDFKGYNWGYPSAATASHQGFSQDLVKGCPNLLGETKTGSPNWPITIHLHQAWYFMEATKAIASMPIALVPLKCCSTISSSLYQGENALVPLPFQKRSRQSIQVAQKVSKFRTWCPKETQTPLKGCILNLRVWSLDKRWLS